jgi:hypothetical protein
VNCIISSTTDRAFIHLSPTADTFTPSTVTAQFTRLYYLLASTKTPSTLEWVLVTDGSDTGPIEYVLSVDTALASTIEAWCRELVPNSFDISTTMTDPLRCLSPADADADPDDRALESYAPPRYRAVEFVGVTDRREDWQTTLTRYDEFTDKQSRLPLATVVSALADASVPMAVQILVRPYPDWRHHALDRKQRLKQGRETAFQRFFEDWVLSTDSENNVSDPRVRSRVDALDEKDAQHSFVVTARAVAATTDQRAQLPDCTPVSTAFSHLNGDHYRIEGRIHDGDRAKSIYESLRNRVVVDPEHAKLTARLPWTDHASRGLVMDGCELPLLCLVDAATLPTKAHRALAPTPTDEHGLPRPPRDRIERYRTAGLTLGHAQTADGDAEAVPISLPPALQPLHLGMFGRTGSGKSSTLVAALLANHAATDGADIFIDPKGDGMADDYLKAHYAKYGSLDDVYYFDCTETLPALSFFDIRDQLDAGIDRTTAVEDVVDHYIDILIGIMGRDRFSTSQSILG